MVKKTLLLLTVFTVVLMSGAISAFADDTGTDCQVYNADEDVSVPAYCDGRINAYDIMQPVAISYTTAAGTALNDDGEEYPTEVITGIALWGVDDDSNGYLAFWVGIDDINAAMTAAQVTNTNVTLGEAYGLILTYVPAADMFWVTGPAYSFTWDAW
ncbi:MAG: hypothetical protein JXA10_06405 [Anaerolineae bacterium]|nr:hypothetical protein [Anaerolineae bacterium]